MPPGIDISSSPLGAPLPTPDFAGTFGRGNFGSGGLIGTLKSVFGGAAGGPLSIGLSAVASLLGGDGGRGKRLRAAEGAIGALEGGKFDPKRFAQVRKQFLESLLPFTNNLFAEGAKRVGLDSGKAVNFAATQAQAPLASFSANEISRQFAEIEANKRAAASFRTQLAVS